MAKFQRKNYQDISAFDQGRRDFFKKSVGSLLAGSSVGQMLSLSSALGSSAGGGGSGGPILILVHQSGGNDSLNTVIPYANSESEIYYNERPELAIPTSQVLPLSDGIGLHPKMTGLQALWGDGDLAIVNGVGYPTPNLSHFRSRDIWESSNVEANLSQGGWIGRFFDHACDNTVGFDPLTGIEVRSTNSRAFRSIQGNTALTVKEPEQLRFFDDGEAITRRSNGLDDSFVLNSYRRILKQQGVDSSDTLDFVRASADTAIESAVRVAQATENAGTLDGNYPSGSFGKDMSNITRYIRGGAPSSVYFAVHGGYDTHAGQSPLGGPDPTVGRHANLLSTFDQAISALASDLKASGDWNRVVLMSYSEFGRKVPQNGSAGTDHGAAGSVFMAGGGVSGGFHGAFPELAEAARVSNNSLAYNTDYRSLYRTVLERWLGVGGADVNAILGSPAGGYPLVDFLT